MAQKILSILYLFLFLGASFEDKPLKDLAGGTLIDGYGSAPIKNSVIIIEGEKIKTVGTMDSTPIPSNAEIIEVDGDVLHYISLLQDVYMGIKHGERYI